MSRSNVSSLPLQDFSLWDKMHARNAVFSFDLELTARCNCSCRHCYVNLDAGDRLAKEAELSASEISRIADEAVALGAMWCLLTGGEPLLREDFCDIYLDLKRKGLLISIFTNAQLLTDRHIKLFSKYPPRDIEITVYGITRETYERITQTSGSFAAFNDGFSRLLGSGVKVRLKAMALRSNLAELPEIARLCREQTKDYFRFDPFLHARFDGNRQRNEEIRAERLSAQEIVVLEQADEERANSMLKKCGELSASEIGSQDCDHLFHCGAGRGSFYVGYGGHLRLCSSLCHPDCTFDLRKGTLAEAWGAFIPKVQAMRSSKKEFLETCHVCPIVDLCVWCPAHAHLETGELDGSVKYFCEVAHARAQAFKAGPQSVSERP